ncbi:MAG: periplasmic binding protein [Deltaproteobacteria bacterium]|nr:periplasmic binding protein [Deltaproteobacteria bacterium]
MISITDDVGREVRLRFAARRVISLVPSLTETIFALGRGNVIVAATRYCTEPRAGVHRLERVGGTKNPDVPRICALNPDLVIASAEENRKEDFDALTRAGVTVFVAFPLRAGAVAELVRRLGALLGAPLAAETLAREQEEALRQAKQRRAKRLARVFCAIWKDPWMSFNRDTYAHDMLSCVGARNVCAARDERYFAVTLADIAATAPEIILLPNEPYRFGPGVLSDLGPLCATPAWQANRIHLIDGRALFWYGARTAAGLRVLRSVVTTPNRNARGDDAV